MGKRPNGIAGKKQPTPSASKRPTRPMTLGDMRSLGPRSLEITCKTCGYHTIFNVDAWPGEVLVMSFGKRMRCIQCGHLGAHVMPDWRQLRRAPGMPRR